MAQKKLPGTNRPRTTQVRQLSEQRGPEVLSDRFPAVSNVLSRSKDTLFQRSLDLTNKKTKDRGYQQIQNNLTSLDRMTLFAEEQNILIREIINALKERVGPSLPGRRGRQRIRAAARTRPPGRGRFGQRARQRLRRMQAARRTQRFQRAGARTARAYTAVRRATVTGVERVRGATRNLVDRVSPPPSPTPRTRIEPIFDRTTQAPPPATETRPPPAVDEIERIRQQSQADADRVTAQAQEAAKRTTDAADETARRTVLEAEERARRVTADAEEKARTQIQDAETIRNNAAAEAESIRNRATAEAESIRNRATAEAESIRNRATVEAEEIKRRAATVQERVAPPSAERVPAPTTAPEAGATRVSPQVPDVRVTAGAGRAGALGAGAGALVGEVTGQGAGAAAVASAQTAVTTVVLSQAAEQTIKRTAASFIGKSVATKIPIAGLLAGIWFSAERAMAGDWVGSGLELTSGVAGTLGAVTFGIGTGASVAIDIGLLTRDVYKALYNKFPEEEENVELRNANLAAIGPALTNALNELIKEAPRPETPPITNETKSRLRDIYLMAQENEEIYQMIGEDVMAGLSVILRQNVEGRTPQQVAARNGMASILARLESLLTSRGAATSRMIEIPAQEPPSPAPEPEPAPELQQQTTNPPPAPPVQTEEQPAQEQPQATRVDAPTPASAQIQLPEVREPAAEQQASDNLDLENFLTPASSRISLETPKEDDDVIPVDSGYDFDRVAAEPIVRTLGEDEEIESALPYPENLIEMIGRTEFENIEIEADRIAFEGEIKLTQADNTLMQQQGETPPPAAPPPASPPPPQATQTAAAAPMSTGGGTGGASAPAVQASPVAAAATGGGSAGSTAGLATPVAMPSPAATGIPPAPQPQGAPQQQQQQQGAAPSGDFMTEVNRVSGRLGINPANLLAVMRSESSLNPQAVNRSTGASGLIQFMPRTAQSLGTTVEAIRQMTAVQQMPYVEKFFQSVRLPQGASAGRLYAYVFLPGRANREILTQRGESYYEANKGLDVLPQGRPDGQITIADLDARLARYGGVGGATPPAATMQAAAPATGGALASAGTGMVAADQAQARSGGQTMIVQTQAPQTQGAAPNIVPPQSSAGEVPLNIRLQRQVA